MKKQLKLKRKVPFYLFCILWLGSLLVGGILFGNPMIATLLMCFFSLLAIWQMDINEEKTTKYALIMLGVNTLLGCMAMSVSALLQGDEDALLIAVVVLVTLAVIVGLPILIVVIIARKNKTGWNEPLIQDKHYDEEKWQRVKKKSYGVAGRGIIFGWIGDICLKQLLLSLVLLIVTPLTAYLIVESKEERSVVSFSQSGGIYIWISCICLIGFAVAGIGCVIAYKRLEAMCIHLGFELEGAREVNEAAASANAVNQLGKATGVPVVQGRDLLSGTVYVMQNYRVQNGKATFPDKIRKIFSIMLGLLQIGVAIWVIASIFCLH